MIRFYIKHTDGTKKRLFRDSFNNEDVQISVAWQGMNKDKFKKLVEGINEVIANLEPKVDDTEEE